MSEKQIKNESYKIDSVKANDILANAKEPLQRPYRSSNISFERPISPVYATIDTDLARDNLENDIPAADLSDL